MSMMRLVVILYKSVLLLTVVIFATSWSLSSLPRRHVWKFVAEGVVSSGSLLLTMAEEQQKPPSLLTKEEQEYIRKRLMERRQLMEASRSSNNRQSYLDLSRQRAALYNTTSKAAVCPPNIPCL
jgi:hypothetical protein